MSRYEQQNRQVIQKSLARMLASEQERALAAMCKVAEAGLQYLLDAHDAHEMFMSHTQETDTIGYAVAHNGSIVATRAHDGGGDDLPGSAVDEATRVLAGTSGWVAVILSDMQGWYRVDYETQFLFYSADMVKENFRRFFKQVK